jgi:hypothetical protein
LWQQPSSERSLAVWDDYINIKIDDLYEMLYALDKISTTFSVDAPYAREAGLAIGNGGSAAALAIRLDFFSDEWRIKREALVDEIQAMYNRVGAIIHGWEEADRQLAGQSAEAPTHFGKRRV